MVAFVCLFVCLRFRSFRHFPFARFRAIFIFKKEEMISERGINERIFSVREKIITTRKTERSFAFPGQMSGSRITIGRD